jgi:hypothetical protein
MQIEQRRPRDLDELCRKASHERNAKQRNHYRAVALALHGYTTPQIRHMLARSKNFVQRWNYAYRDGGIDPLLPKPNPGRPVIPLDAILALPESEFSYVLQDWDQGFCVSSSYGQSRCQIERILRIGQSVLSLEQMNGQMAVAAEGFWASEPPPASETEGPIMVLTADGKGCRCVARAAVTTLCV